MTVNLIDIFMKFTVLLPLDATPFCTFNFLFTGMVVKWVSEFGNYTYIA